MTDQPVRKATWLDRMSVAMVLALAVAVVAVAVGVVLTVLRRSPGTAWAVAGGAAVAVTGLFIVAVVVEAVRGGEKVDGAGPGGEGEHGGPTT